MENEAVSKNFIEQIIEKDLAEGHCETVKTRFPPEPNGYLHIGHAKSILLNSGLAKKYGGEFNLRFDDTNPTKEKLEFVESIKEDVKWLGADWGDRLFFASNYFDQMYEAAIKLIKKGKAYVSDLSADEIREYRGTLTEPGKEDPYAKRSVEENLALFEEMKEGKCEDGSRVLRARIDMTSSNINMRDPILYRVAHMTHHNTGDKWCIYPMYDFAHPIEDAIEGITHSICTLEFEDHRPLYDWVVTELGYKTSPEGTPKQIEFAKLYLTNVVTGKRYIKRLVEEKIVDGWDDPRLVSIAALRRRGYTPESIQKFIELGGISKANSSTDYAMLEYCIREDLKMKRPRMMAVLDPVKVVIDNYPEGQVEYLPVDNNLENPELGSREVPFTRELYIQQTKISRRTNNMSKFINPTKVITGPDTRWSYANVWEAKSINGGAPKYSVSLIIPKSDTKTVEKIKAAIEAAYKDGESKLKGNGRSVPALSAIKNPLRDGDTERPDDEAYANSYFINANSATAPGIVDANCSPILERSEVYSGVYGRASISFYAFNSNGNKGIACGLNNLQKLRDGEPLGGRTRAEDDFATEAEAAPSSDDDFLS